MLRILFLLHEPFGSIGNAASYFYPEYVSESAEVLVVSPPFAEGQSAVNLPKKATVHWLRPGNLLFRIAEIRNVINAFAPDIVHLVYNPRLLPCFLIDRLLTSSKRAWIADIRSPLLAQGITRQAARILTAALLPRFSLVLTHAEGSLGSYSISSRTPWRLLPPGVDTAALKPRTYSPKISRLVFIGSLTPQRNLDVLLNGFALLTQSFPSITLDIFGDGPDRSRLEALCSQLRLTTQVKFRGLVLQEKLHALLPAYDCGVGYVPQGDFDAAPTLKVIEYAASGLHIVASDTQFHRQWQKQGMNLTLFRNTPESLAEIMTEVLQASTCRSKIQDNIIFAQFYDWKKITLETLLPIYSDVPGPKS